MWDAVASGNLASIANLIGERGEKAKQPLPVSFGAISRQLSAKPIPGTP
jgi:hypothetical protein